MSLKIHVIIGCYSTKLLLNERLGHKLAHLNNNLTQLG